jgi:hypothetical protein
MNSLFLLLNFPIEIDEEGLVRKTFQECIINYKIIHLIFIKYILAMFLSAFLIVDYLQIISSNLQ